MTLKEELEILRGEPIEVFTGDPMDIPCIETSDPDKLCKHPVVSVNMITYNHEPYIRQAIEGVMMQKTDFEFELIIGEDASTDKTREICFEYQKRYPDKIRVLWWHENLYRNPHPAGGNGKRNMAHCRGEFIALCEGDDYWIDPLKLQKQVDVMRKYPNVALCFGGAKVSVEYDHSKDHQWNEPSELPAGLIRKEHFFDWHLYGVNGDGKGHFAVFLITATTMFRHEHVKLLKERHELYCWRLALGDTPLWLGLASIGDVYNLPDTLAVYRRNAGGACYRNMPRVGLDATVSRIYWAVVMKRLKIANALVGDMFETLFSRMINASRLVDSRRVARGMIAIGKAYSSFSSQSKWWIVLALSKRGLCSLCLRWFVRFRRKLLLLKKR